MRLIQVVVIAAAGGALACAESSVPSPMSPDGPAADIVIATAGPPFYTIAANGGFIPNDGTWAALPFLRRIECVPPGANLLEIAGGPAFACQPTIEGHEHWENGPGVDPAPRQTVFRGLGAVPILFARWNEVQAATADGDLTLAELLDLPSVIVGTAHAYSEIDILGVSGPLGPGRGMYKITARGVTGDGRSFDLHVNEVLGQLRVVQIDFR